MSQNNPEQCNIHINFTGDTTYKFKTWIQRKDIIVFLIAIIFEYCITYEKCTCWKLTEEYNKFLYTNFQILREFIYSGHVVTTVPIKNMTKYDVVLLNYIQNKDLTFS